MSKTKPRKPEYLMSRRKGKEHVVEPEIEEEQIVEEIEKPIPSKRRGRPL